MNLADTELSVLQEIRELLKRLNYALGSAHSPDETPPE